MFVFNVAYEVYLLPKAQVTQVTDTGLDISVDQHVTSQVAAGVSVILALGASITASSLTWDTHYRNILVLRSNKQLVGYQVFFSMPKANKNCSQLFTEESEVIIPTSGL